MNMEENDIMEDGRVGSSRISSPTKTTIELERIVKINYFRMIECS
jgi:hypothetical protein